jgi:hypothetical protein
VSVSVLNKSSTMPWRHKGQWTASSPGHFNPRERAPGTHWIECWVGPRADLVDMKKWNLLILPGLKPTHLGHPAHSQLLYWLYVNKYRTELKKSHNCPYLWSWYTTTWKSRIRWQGFSKERAHRNSNRTYFMLWTISVRWSKRLVFIPNYPL